LLLLLLPTSRNDLYNRHLLLAAFEMSRCKRLGGDRG
jgi:hypothetical protein